MIAPLVDNGKTKVISGEELKQIQEQRGVEPVADVAHNMEPDEEYDEDEDEEEEESGLNPKFDKAVTIMGIVMAAIILIVIIYLNGNTDRDADRKPDGVTDREDDRSRECDGTQPGRCAECTGSTGTLYVRDRRTEVRQNGRNDH